MKKEHRYCDICKEDRTDHCITIRVPVRSQRDPADGREHTVTKEVDFCTKCAEAQLRKHYTTMGIDYGRDFLKGLGVSLN